LNELVPAFFSPNNSDIPPPDLKMGRQDLYQGLVGPALYRGRSQIDLHPAFLFHYFVPFGPGDHPDGKAHRFNEKIKTKRLTINN
jgi:hypothetical protein